MLIIIRFPGYNCGGDLSGVMVYILTLAQVLIWPYFFCHFASSAIDHVTVIQRSVYNLNWYNFPPDLRKYFILIIAQSLWTVCFDGLSLVRCTLFNFGMVTPVSGLSQFNRMNYFTNFILYLQLIRSAFHSHII